MAEAEDPMSGADQGESRLQRWSRRKLAVDADSGGRLPPESEPAAQQHEPEAAASAVVDTPVDEQPADAPAPLPELDTLGAESDYAGFMAPEVEPDLRRAALRKLFALPQFALRDGLDDYDHDFTKFEGLGDMVTHEMKRMAAREAHRLAQQALESEAHQPMAPMGPVEPVESIDDPIIEAPIAEVVAAGDAEPESKNRTA